MTNFLEILKKLLRLKNHWNIKKFEAETYPRAQKVMAVRWTWKKLSFQANSEKNTHWIPSKALNVYDLEMNVYTWWLLIKVDLKGQVNYVF